MNKIEAIMVDEGIKGYRAPAIEIARKYCEKNGIKHHITKIGDEIGTGMDGIMTKLGKNSGLGGPCTFCGVFRRKALNKKALEIGADRLATGHNLDDEAQSAAMSFFDNSLAGIGRGGDATNGKKGKMVGRIKPLYLTPEKEIIAYASLIGLEYYADGCCPYSWMAKRNYYRKMLNELDDNFPGTKFKIVEAAKKLKPLLAEAEIASGSKISECASCGEPSNAKLCGTCRLMEKLENMKTSGRAKSRIKIPGQSCAAEKGIQPALRY